MSALLLWQLAAPLSRAWRLSLLVGFVTLYPLSYGLRLGQFSPILLVAWAGAFLLLRQGHERAAGVVLALLLIKPELALPAALFLASTRRLRALASLSLAAGAAALASVALVGLPTAVSYPLYLLHSTAWSGNGTATSLMFGLPGLLTTFYGPAASTGALVAAAILALATLATAAPAWRRMARAGEPSLPRQWLLLTLVTLLVDPHLYLQDVVLIAPAAVAFLASLEVRPRRIMAAGMALGWLVLGLRLLPIQQLHVNIFSAALALGMLTLLVRELRPHAPGPREVCLLAARAAFPVSGVSGQLLRSAEQSIRIERSVWYGHDDNVEPTQAGERGRGSVALMR